jgi:hypothetical protein
MPGPQKWLPYIESGSAVVWEVQICFFCQTATYNIFDLMV